MIITGQAVSRATGTSVASLCICTVLSTAIYILTTLINVIACESI